MLARWDDVVSDDERPDLREILEVARRAGARYVLVGSAVGAGPEVGLVGDIYDASSGEKLGTARAEGTPDSLMALVDRFSVGATRVLLAGGDDGSAIQHLASLTTPSLEALLAYIEGEQAYRVGSWDAALGAYERALEHDSTFALAHLRAAQVLGWTETGSPVIVRHQEAAGRFADRMPARERALLAALVGVRNADVDEVEAAGEAVRRYPDDPDLWNALGELQFHVGRKALRPVEEGLEALERAAELADQPTGPQGALDVMDALALWRTKGAKAAEGPLLEAYARIPTFVVEYVQWMLAELYDDLGDEPRAFEYYRAAAQSIPYAALRAARLADRLGETEEARRLYREVLIAWKDADPQFEPWQEEARGWLERLPG